MRKILNVLFVWMTILLSAYGAGDTPIKYLKLTSSANGGWYNFTNLNTIAVSNITAGTISVTGSVTIAGGPLVVNGTNVMTMLYMLSTNALQTNAWVWVQANSNNINYLW